jgi:DNA-binding MarR family transcriptional regulator
VKMDAMTASSVLRKLETMGYVERQASKTDSRARSLRVTPAGKAIAGKAIRAVEQYDHDFFAYLGKDLPRFAKDMITLLHGHANTAS